MRSSRRGFGKVGGLKSQKGKEVLREMEMLQLLRWGWELEGVGSLRSSW